MSGGGLRYVDEFEFPADQGFTGSAGKSNVKGYMRGGAVKKDPVKKAAQTPRAPGPGAAKGGSVSMHDKLVSEGAKMGYAYGGKVKGQNTSGAFVQTTGPQDTMDSGTTPPQSSNQAEKEAGGRARTKPKFAKGGGVRTVKDVPMERRAYRKGGKVGLKDVPGEGALKQAARGAKKREARTRRTVSDALKASRAAMGISVQDTAPRKEKGNKSSKKR